LVWGKRKLEKNLRGKKKKGRKTKGEKNGIGVRRGN